MCKSPLFTNYFFWILLSLWRTGGGWIIHIRFIYNKYSIHPPPPRFPLVSFCRCCFIPAVFFRCRSKNRRCFLIVHGWTWFYAATSLTFRQTRFQALYKDVQRLIEDTASIAVRKQPSLYMYAFSPYRRNWL